MPRISAATIGEHRAQTQEKILEAIARLARRQGIDAISMTELAAEAGITRTVLYNYFPDKTALLLAFTERVTQYFVESYARDLPGRRLTVDPAAGLHPPPAHRPGRPSPPRRGRPVRHPRPRRLPAPGGARRAHAGDPAGDHPDRRRLGRVPDAPTWRAAARAVLAVLGSERIPLTEGGRALEEAEEFVSGLLLRALRCSSARLTAVQTPVESRGIRRG